MNESTHMGVKRALGNLVLREGLSQSDPEKWVSYIAARGAGGQGSLGESPQPESARTSENTKQAE